MRQPHNRTYEQRNAAAVWATIASIVLGVAVGMLTGLTWAGIGTTMAIWVLDYWFGP